jgi:hypothetical protein
MACKRLNLPATYAVIAFLAVCCSAYGQVASPEKEIRLHALPSLTATNSSDVLAAALEIIFNDKQICCGKNSALENVVKLSDPASLKDIAGKLQGRHILSDGRPVMVTVEYLPSV